MNLSKYTKPTLDEWQSLLNLTEDEEKVFLLLAKGKSIKEIADKIGMSTRTVDNRIASIRRKMEQLGGWENRK
ncbi:MAG: helix-turn-helix transcriptional regulator [Clostridiales bacterium]|nr:helix-turn-helix transcriptional regulator [Clostridiales bacterium]